MVPLADSLPQPSSLSCRGRTLLLAGRMHAVGIINVTPDSFYDGGRTCDVNSALVQARRMVAEGASFLDVGGQSTRPGHIEISAEEEIARVVPVIRALVAELPVLVSIDTYKYLVAEAALAAGAHVINDVWGLQRDDTLARLAAATGAAVIAMHQERDFSHGQGDPIARLGLFFQRTLSLADAAGLPRSRVVLDPGIGFGKSQEQNLALIARLGELHGLGCPLLLAASRKSVIGNVLDLPPAERLEGTLATTALAASQGVQFVRVHDVAANLRTARMTEALRAQLSPA
jgi:dihydropteroate synthase